MIVLVTFSTSLFSPVLAADLWLKNNQVIEMVRRDPDIVVGQTSVQLIEKLWQQEIINTGSEGGLKWFCNLLRGTWESGASSKF